MPTTYTKQLQNIVREYRRTGGAWPASTKTIAEWAIGRGLWELPAAAAVKVCANELAGAMREEFMTDARGRRVRVKHPATIRRRDGTQYTIWDDIRTASHDHMAMAFQQRRHQIVADCRQLKTDVDSYNDAHIEDRSAIQIVFDFRQDLAELEAAAAA